MSSCSSYDIFTCLLLSGETICSTNASSSVVPRCCMRICAEHQHYKWRRTASFLAHQSLSSWINRRAMQRVKRYDRYIFRQIALERLAFWCLNRSLPRNDCSNFCRCHEKWAVSDCQLCVYRLKYSHGPNSCTTRSMYSASTE